MTKHMLDPEWDLRSALCLDLSEMYSYVPEYSAFAQICAIAAATGVRCCELANSVVLQWLFRS